MLMVTSDDDDDSKSVGSKSEKVKTRRNLKSNVCTNADPALEIATD